MSEAVLDSSALIALLLREPGGSVVTEMLPRSVMCSVNLTEVITRMLDEGFTPERAHEVVSESNVQTVSFDEGLARTAGFLRASTRVHGLSLGDRACLALAQRMALPAVTADRRWARVSVGVEVRLIRG